MIAVQPKRGMIGGCFIRGSLNETSLGFRTRGVLARRQQRLVFLAQNAFEQTHSLCIAESAL